jgi:hypothetical protein
MWDWESMLIAVHLLKFCTIFDLQGTFIQAPQVLHFG